MSVFSRLWLVSAAVASFPTIVAKSLSSQAQASDCAIEGPTCSNSTYCYMPGHGKICSGIWTSAWSDICKNAPGMTNGIPDALSAELTAISLDLLWGIGNGTCPYGTKLPGSVTWPNPPEELRGVVASLDWLKVTAVIYSYLPFLIGGCVFISFVIHRGTRQLWVLMYLCLMVCLTEFILKDWLCQPRPGNLMQVRDYSGKYVGSCATTCGMPSGHSCLAMGWFTLLFLDAAVRTHPFRNMATSTQREEFFSTQVQDERCCRRELNKAQKLCAYLLVVPWVDSETLTTYKFVAYVAAWMFIMVPVPFMRVVLNDHTVSQAFVGIMLGMVLAVVWWRVVRYYQHRFAYLEGHRVCGGFLVHNYKLPRFNLNRDGDSFAVSTLSMSHLDLSEAPTALIDSHMAEPHVESNMVEPDVVERNLFTTSGASLTPLPSGISLQVDSPGQSCNT